MTHLEKSTLESTSDETVDSKINVRGAGELIIGGGLLAFGVNGIDTHEAGTAADALGSITYGGDEVYITTADIGYATVALAGIGLVLAGWQRIRSSR